MSYALSDIKHFMVSRDTNVYIFNDKLITIETSLVEGGKISTYSKKEAKTLLHQVMAFGDEVPHGVFTELDKL